MVKSSSELRLAENEVLFREANEEVPKALAALKSAAESEGHGSLVKNVDMLLHFSCECSDENCRKKIILKPSKYRELHQNRSQFLLIPGHNVPEIERIVLNEDKYMVVEKYKVPPLKAARLNATPSDNT